MTIRKGTTADLPQVLELIKELAVFERAPKEVINTLEKMQHEFEKTFHVLVAEDNGTMYGIAVYYYAYSTWKGKYIYLDDLIVTETSRNKGIGRKLVEALFGVAKAEGISLLRWHVLNWNTPAIEFYKRYNPIFDNEWITVKVNL